MKYTAEDIEWLYEVGLLTLGEMDMLLSEVSESAK